MMCECRGCNVSGLEEGFSRESQNVIVLGEVEEPVAVSSDRDETGKSKLGEVL